MRRKEQRKQMRPITTAGLHPSVVFADDNQSPVLVNGLRVSLKGTWLSTDGKEKGAGNYTRPIITDSDWILW